MEIKQENCKGSLEDVVELATSLDFEEELRLSLILIFFRLLRESWRVDKGFKVEQLAEDKEWQEVRERFLLPSSEEIGKIFDLFEEEIEARLENLKSNKGKP